MDLSILAKDAVCHVCGKKGHFAKDCWHQSGNKGSGKGKKGKEGQGKYTKPKDGDAKQKGACHNCGEVGHFARECPNKKEASNASSSGGGGVHCLTYTDDQSHWIMMLAEVGQNQEQSNNIEFFGGFWSCMPCVAVQNKTWFNPWRDIFDCHRSASCNTGYAGCVISIVGRAWCGNQCESHVRIASCPPSNPECESSC